MDKAGLRPAQVGASTAAAVSGAFLASRIGVYGTIIGVGVISLMSTVGSEMLLRSLDRTKQVARTASPRQRTKATVFPAAAPDSPSEAATAEQPVTAALPEPPAATTEQPVKATPPAAPAVPEGDQPPKASRWPLVAGAFLASFGLALAVIVGIESLTGRSLDGDAGPTIVTVFRGDDQSTDDTPSVPTSTVTQGDDEPAGGTTPEPDESPAPDENQTTPPDEETPPPAGEETPPADADETPPPDEETPPDEVETPPADEETPAP